MEDMGNYFRKWREWRYGDLDSKSFTSIKGAEEEERRLKYFVIFSFLNEIQQFLPFNFPSEMH